MSDNDNNNSGLLAFFQQVWAGVVFVFGVVSAILGYIKLADGDLGLFTLVLLGVGVAGLFTACFYYAVVWKPEINDGKPLESVIITPSLPKPVAFQGKKEKQRKRVRWVARMGILLIPILVWGGYRFYQHQASLPPTDFKILIANFETDDAEDHRVTQEIFRNLEREMEKYGDDVKVEKLEKSLGSIQAAKTAGKEKKAAIVIWGDYQVMEDIVPISLNFEILQESANYIKLGESVQGKTQPAQLSELTSFKLQTNLSQEMTYLSLFTLGMYRYLDQDWEQAIEYHNRALAISSETNEPIASLGKELVYFYLGNSFYYRKLYQEALSHLDKTIEINPNNDIVWNNRGIALGKLGKYKEAIASFDKATEINPDKDVAWYNRGVTFGKLGKYQEAISSYDKAIEINPDKDIAWYSRGVALGKLGKYKEAISSFDKTIGINPDKDIAWYSRGVALGNLGRHQEALSSYDKAVEINSNYDSAWNNRGVTFGKLGKYQEAIASYDKAIKINSNYDTAWYNRGNTLGKLGKYQEAIASYDKAIKINPNLDQAWNNRGIALGKLGRHKETISSYDKAIKINPDNDTAWYNRAGSYALQNNIDVALKNLEQAFSLNSELREDAKTDTDFDAIRGDQRFKDLIENK